MTVDISDALAARDGRSLWALRCFSFKDAEEAWRTAPHRDNVQAFEEKFDLFAMLPLPARPRAIATRTFALPELALEADGRLLCCRTSRHAYTNAWFVREPRRHAGVAAFLSGH